MGHKEPALELDTHTLLIPYGFTLFGKMYEMPLMCLFGYSGDLKTNHALEIKSLTGFDPEGLECDMMYLVEDEESVLTRLIIASILNNYSNWDKVYEEGSEDVWWSNKERGLVE